MSGARWPGACAQPTRIGTGSALAGIDASARNTPIATAAAVRLMGAILGSGFARDQPCARIAAVRTTDPHTIPNEPIGGSLITGFLGSGKTTLLNSLLRHSGMSDTAVIVNEFGEVGLDHLLIETALDNAVLLKSGCLCCTLRGDLVDTLTSLFERRRRAE